MNDEDFMNELQELTKNMTQEFSMSKVASVKEGSNSKPEIDKMKDFDMNFGGSEADYLKEIEKMFQGQMNFDIDDSDPQAKEMMKLLSLIKNNFRRKYERFGN